MKSSSQQHHQPNQMSSTIPSCSLNPSYRIAARQILEAICAKKRVGCLVFDNSLSSCSARELIDWIDICQDFAGDYSTPVAQDHEIPIKDKVSQHVEVQLKPAAKNTKKKADTVSSTTSKTHSETTTTASSNVHSSARIRNISPQGNGSNLGSTSSKRSSSEISLSRNLLQNSFIPSSTPELKDQPSKRPKLQTLDSLLSPNDLSSGAQEQLPSLFPPTMTATVKQAVAVPSTVDYSSNLAALSVALRKEIDVLTLEGSNTTIGQSSVLQNPTPASTPIDAPTIPFGAPGFWKSKIFKPSPPNNWNPITIAQYEEINWKPTCKPSQEEISLVCRFLLQLNASDLFFKQSEDEQTWDFRKNIHKVLQFVSPGGRIHKNNKWREVTRDEFSMADPSWDEVVENLYRSKGTVKKYSQARPKFQNEFVLRRRVEQAENGKKVCPAHSSYFRDKMLGSS
jgi:hypothetical protein